MTDQESFINNPEWIAILQSKVRESLRDAEVPTPENEAHPAEDAVFLEALLSGSLSEEALENYRNHLAHCAHCRKLMAFYAREGVLNLPEEKLQLEPMPKKRTFLTKRLYAGVTALVLGGVCVWVGIDGMDGIPFGGAAKVSNSSKETQIAKNIPTPVTAPDVVQETKELPEMEPASEESPDARLAAIQTYNTLVLPDDHPELVSITGMNYCLNGFLPGKSLPFMDPHLAEAEKAFLQALDACPHEDSILTEYGAFLLLRKRNAAEAQKVLESVNVPDVRWHQLMGLALFMQDAAADAAAHFQYVCSTLKEEASYDDWLNLAIASFVKGDLPTARTAYETARQKTNDTNQIRALDALLEEIRTSPN